MEFAIGVDIGGTKMRAGVVDRTGELHETGMVRTPEDPGEVLISAFDVIGRTIDMAPGKVGAIGIGAAGLVDVAAGVVRYAPNLPYRQVPLVTAVSDKFGVPVCLDNDATCAGYAEFKLGAGRGSDHLVMVTVGTGIGGGFVFGGDVYRGTHGFAAEIGHMVIDPQGPLCGCGQRGCWERMASGTALGEMARELASTPDGAAILRVAGGEVSAVRGEHTAAAAELGDPAAIGLVEQLGSNLGFGLANLANILDPERFVIGGGVAKTGETLLGTARLALAARMEGAGYRPEIPVVQAELGDDAGLVGAGLLASELG